MNSSVNKPRILYVDDDTDFLEVFSIMFCEMLDITPVDNVSSALEHPEGNRYDMVITDFNMPEMNGLELLNVIKTKYPLMPVIFHTGQGSEDIAREAFTRGAFDYFTKDLFDFARKERLMNFINRAVETARISDEKIKTEERLNLTLDATSDGIWDWNLVTGEVYFSPRWYTMLGYHPYEMPPSYSTWKELLHEEDREMAEKIVRDAIFDQQERFSLEFRMKTKGGNFKWILARGKVVKRNERQEAIRLVGTHMDITSAKKTEETLKASENQFRNIIENSPLGMHLYELLPDNRLVFIGANASADRILGIDHRPLIGKTIEEAFPPLAHTEIPQKYREVALSGISYHRDEIDYRDDKMQGIYEIHAFQSSPDRMVASFRDVTALRKAEETQKKLVSIIENSRDFMGIASLQGQVTYLNRAGREMVGLENSADVRNLRILDFVDEKMGEELQNKIFVNLFQSGQSSGQGSLRHFKTGEVIDVEYNVFLLKSPITGMASDIAVLMRDIRDKKQKDQEVQCQKEKFYSIFNAIPLGIGIVASQDQRIKEANPAFCSLLGYTREEMLKKTVMDITHPEDMAWERKEIEEVIKGDKPYCHIEKRYIRKDGEVRWVKLLGSPFPVHPDEPFMGVGIVEDITRQKQAEKEQKLTIDILNLLNRSYSDKDLIKSIMILIQDFTEIEAIGIRLKEEEDYPYYVTNGFPEEFVKSENYLCARGEDGEILRDENGKPILECMCGNIILGRTDPFKPFFTEGGSFWCNCTTELLATTTDEDRRTRNYCNIAGYESVALIPLRSGKNVLGLLQLNDHRKNRFTPELITFLENIGCSIGIAIERRFMEQQLMKKNEELNDFSQRVSHDIKGPLNIIKGFALTIKKRPELFDKYFDQINRQSDKILSFIARLLNLSRSGKTIDKKEKIHLPTLLETVFRSIKPQDVDAELIIQEPMPVLKGDPLSIEELFSNIIENSIKYGDPEKEKVIINISAIEENREKILIICRDNGRGIEKDYHEKIFNPGFVLSKNKGTGFGLTICKKIVEAHGGEIYVHSKGKNQGAEFRIHLPL